MRNISYRYKLLVILLALILFTLACFAEGPYTRERKEKIDGFEITGTVIDTWSWGDNYPTCDSQEKMSITIAEDKSVVMRLSGPCYFLSCTPIESDLPCGLVVYGNYDYEKDLITLSACNNIDTKNGSGTIQLGTMEERHYISSGNVSCTFDSEKHTIQQFMAP